CAIKDGRDQDQGESRVRPAIQFEAVSRKFILQRQRPRSFQELALSLLRRQGREPPEEYWALRDVSFQVAPGESVGLIGPNGAGKSTALKLIARIIEPTSGRIRIEGRVGALLELGAGFHQDLTGRENIYLNGAILGISRAQIQRKLDEIIAFAELERFIDVPVKHYSSGMYVRLGFSVAAFTDPEVLVVDEALGVGDAAFQRKSMERIAHLQQAGVTILLVSHSLDAVRNVCQRAIWMDEGRLVADDATETVLRQYIWHSYRTDAAAVIDDAGRRWGSGEVKIEGVRFLDDGGEERQVWVTGERLRVEIRYRACERVERPVFGLAVHRGDGTHVSGPNTQFAGYEIPWVEGDGVVQYTVPSLPLLEGSYYLSVAVHDSADTQMFDYHDRLYPFQVVHMEGERYGLVTLQGGWSWNGQATKDSF
ncbi:MAG: ABC transporter ATP-binding protein, partial [Anaerolineae bacterium]